MRDPIERQEAIDALRTCYDTETVTMDNGDEYINYDDAVGEIEELPSAQPEPPSDAYVKSVWKWLLNYQIKAAELKGRYTPYEVLSWVVNDWRKEHERSN